MFRPPIGPLTTQGLAIWTIFMALTDLVVPQAVVPSLRVNSKKQALQELAARAAAISTRNEREVLEGFMQRHPLGAPCHGTPHTLPHSNPPHLTRLSVNL